MQHYTIEINGKHYTVEVVESGAESYRVVVDGAEYRVHLAKEDGLSLDDTQRQIVVEAASAETAIDHDDLTGLEAEIRAPMPGVVLSVAVQPGDKVRTAQPVVVLEAMKMKNRISSPRDGVVAEVVVQAGQSVAYDDVLLRFEATA